MKLQISVLTASLASAAILAWPTAALALKDLVIHVDCASGDRVGAALGRPTVFDRRLVIVVNGTCAENVTIERDDVTLKAGASGSGISAADVKLPAILINGARRITLDALSVSGGLHAVQATNGAAVAIRGGNLRNASQNGAFIYNSSSATIDASTLENNGNSGIAVVNSSSATVTGNTVRGNALYGVVLSRAAGVIVGNYDPMTGEVCCGNVIQNNGLDGVLAAEASAAHLYGNTIEGNGALTSRWGVLAVRESSIVLRGKNVLRANGSATGGGGAFARQGTINTGPGDTPVIPSSNEISGGAFGIIATHNSLVDLRGGTSITGNTRTGVSVEVGSRMRTDGSQITTNGWQGIFAGRASSIELIGVGNVVSSNGQWGLLCGDNESSYNGPTDGVSGNTVGNVNCTGY